MRINSYLCPRWGKRKGGKEKKNAGGRGGPIKGVERREGNEKCDERQSGNFYQ